MLPSAIHNSTEDLGLFSLHFSTYWALHFVPHSSSRLCLRLTNWLSPHPGQSLAYPRPVSCCSGWNVFHWFSAHWRSQLKHRLLLRASLETTTFHLSALEFVTHVSFLMNQTVHCTKSATALLAGRYLLLSTMHRTLI